MVRMENKAGILHGGIHLATSFDLWQFYDRPYKVNARWEAGEAVATGLDYGDAERVQIQDRTWGPGRWYRTPEWTLDREKVALVLVTYLEQSAMLQKADKAKSLPDRFRIAYATSISRREHLRATISRMWNELQWVSARHPEDMPRISALRRQICTYQTQLVHIETIPQILAAILWQYFRLGTDAHSIGRDLGVSHAHVRQVLTRIRNRAEALGFASRTAAETRHAPRCRASIVAAKPQPVDASYVPGLGQVRIVKIRGHYVDIEADGRTMTVHRLRLPEQMLEEVS